MANWDDLVSLKNPGNMPAGTDEELSYYFLEYKDFDNLFDEALTTLQDLDVPSGYGQVPPPPPRGPQFQNQALTPSHFRHAKKPSGTAIFGFLDHNRELSLSGNLAGEDVPRLNKTIPDQVASISPTQLARTPHMAISNEQLDFNFDEPLEACKPIHLNEEDEENEEDENIPMNGPGMGIKTPMKPVADDMIVTNKTPASYKFPPPMSTSASESSGAHGSNFDSFLNGTVRPMPQVHHPKREHTYPRDIDDLEAPKSKRYVPIPVREPVREPVLSSLPTFRSPVPPQSNTYMSQEYSRLYPGSNNNNGGDQLGMNMNMNMNMNIYLPPPSASLLSQASPEPHSPLPQQAHLTLSPLRHRNSHAHGTPMMDKRNFYQPQFFSDDGEGYYPEAPSRFGLSPQRELPQLSPIRQMQRNTEAHADDTIDANETILQLTPVKNHAPITPSTNRITLEWSPIILPNGKATKDVRRAIQELSPKRMMKKTSLLPPGELDKYWEGPDDEKNFTCTYQNCGKKFTRRYNVRSHIQTHLSDRPFTCTYCPKSFVRQHDLNRHVKSHMVSKHCRCKCGREFTRIEGYKKHLANGVCLRPLDDGGSAAIGTCITTAGCGGVSKPHSHRPKGENILDGLTLNRLHDDLQLDG